MKLKAAKVDPGNHKNTYKSWIQMMSKKLNQDKTPSGKISSFFFYGLTVNAL